MDNPSTTAFDLGRTRDLTGRSRHQWYRRAGLAVMGAVVVAALLGTFGQRDHTQTASGPAGSLELMKPAMLRGGLLWRARIVVRATEKIAAPQLVLGSGFVRGMQLNTIEPSPTSEGSRGSGLAFTYPTLNAGDSLTIYLQLQSDPTIVGAQNTSVSLEGANIAPIRLSSSTRVLP